MKLKRVLKHTINFSSACWITVSDSASKADVASSRSSTCKNPVQSLSINWDLHCQKWKLIRNTLGFLRTALAMARRCFCPPESWTPPSPISVSNFSGNWLIKSSAFATLAASTTWIPGVGKGWEAYALWSMNLRPSNLPHIALHLAYWKGCYPWSFL